MRVPFAFLAPLAAAVHIATVPVRSAVAQPAAAARAVPAVPAGAVTVDPAPRTVATYRFTAARDPFMPIEVTIADSAGVPVATFRLPGDRAARPMAVDLTDTDVALHGETPDGVLTLLFYQPRAASDAGTIAGRWWLGERSGELRGRVTR
jgi:hypothetical protein